MFNSMLPLNKLLLNDLPIVPLVYKAGWLALHGVYIQYLQLSKS
jgi:hypothetical protein